MGLKALPRSTEGAGVAMLKQQGSVTRLQRDGVPCRNATSGVALTRQPFGPTKSYKAVFWPPVDLMCWHRPKT